MKQHPLLILALLALLPSGAPGQDAKRYKIAIERPHVQGEKYEEVIEASNSTSQVISVGGTPQQQEEKSVSGKLSGISETVKVDEDGKALEIRFTVKTFVMKSKGAESKPLPAGKVIVITKKGDKDSFTVEGEEADAETATLLGVMFEVGPRKSEGSDDKGFGTDKPRAAGEEWDIDAKELIASMPKDMPFKLTPDGADGKVKFIEISDVGGASCAHLKADLTLKPTGIQGMPPQVKVSKANLKVGMEGNFPLDDKTAPRTESMSMDFDFAGSMNDPASGTAVAIKIATKMDKKVERKPAN